MECDEMRSRETKRDETDERDSGGMGGSLERDT